ncbi:hypothetical protein NC651_036024 [Populus alba x Populus x berolinensis]|nr:hypothetical protein NC651_036024 [Populus alba x Populus x berolinensis]
MIGRGTRNHSTLALAVGVAAVKVLRGGVVVRVLKNGWFSLGVICMQALSHLWRLADVEQAEGFEGKHKK